MQVQALVKKKSTNIPISKTEFKKAGSSRKKVDRQLARSKKSVVTAIPADDLDSLKKSKKRVLAIDCEFVGAGPEGKESVLARVSIVNEQGDAVYDKYVLPTSKVTDYRTEFSGIRSCDLLKGEPFDNVQQEVKDIMADNIIVGHSFHNDLKVLGIGHARRQTRDTAKYTLIQRKCDSKGRTPSLKLLAQKLLGISIQTGEHCSVEDAKIVMALYQMYKQPWEESYRRRF